MTTATTLQTLASEMSHAFETRTRDNGDKFVCLKDDSPEWMETVCQEAHQDGTRGGMSPDDLRYEMIRESVDAIASHDDESEARDSIEADIYTSDLTGWLHSRVDRYSYCDDAHEEWGSDFGGFVNLLQLGQLREKHEVFDAVLAALQEELDSRDDDDEDDWDTDGIEASEDAESMQDADDDETEDE